MEETIKDSYKIIHMSRVGIIEEYKGIGFGSFLQQFIDTHARITYPNFLLISLTNLDIFDLIKSRYTEENFKKNTLIQIFNS